MSQPTGIPRGFENTYQSFVWRELSTIRELERHGRYYQALELAYSLLKYLQPTIRKELEPRARAIINRVRSEINGAARPDFYMSMVAQNKVAKNLGYGCLEEMITMLSNQLGVRMYMERGSVAPRYKSKKKLSADHIERK